MLLVRYSLDHLADLFLALLVVGLLQASLQQLLVVLSGLLYERVGLLEAGRVKVAGALLEPRIAQLFLFGAGGRD